MPRSLAARTREAARRHPFLLEALAAGVVNYTAGARFLADELDGDPDADAVATALRRFAADLDRSVGGTGARVSMKSGVGVTDDHGETVLSVGDTCFAPGAGSLTALVARGDVDVAALGSVLGRLAAVGVDPVAAGGDDDALVVVVERPDGADALRVVEATLEAVPAVESDD